MRVLITGVTGFVGGHLAEHLIDEGKHELHGLSRSGQWPKQYSEAERKALVAVKLHTVDLTDRAAVERVLQLVRPDWVFHLAGFANPNAAKSHRDDCFRDNLTATSNLYEAMVAVDQYPRVLFASTGLLYADAPPDVPLTEDAPFDTQNHPYKESKAEADALSERVFREHGLPVIRARLFTQIGPRQVGDYAVANFARQIADITRAGGTTVQTLDLTGYRDLTHVGDVVRACRLLIEKGRPGEAYNVGSGHAWQMRTDVLEKLLTFITDRPTVNTPDPNPNAPAPAINRADTAKLQEATGWRLTSEPAPAPERYLEQSLKSVLDWWLLQSPEFLRSVRPNT